MMDKKPAAIFFDKNDYQLLSVVKDVLERGGKSKDLRSLLVEHMHPHGIKEMAAPRGLRIAYAIAGLLGSFEKGVAGDRIKLLRSLRDEVFLTSTTFFQKNTARVLLQIMKDLLRARDNELARAVKLADLADNSDRTRLGTVTEDDERRLLKYAKARAIILDVAT